MRKIGKSGKSGKKWLKVGKSGKSGEKWGKWEKVGKSGWKSGEKLEKLGKNCSQEEITHRVELEYRLFLSIDSSLYRPKTIFFRGCAKFRPLAFF